MITGGPMDTLAPVIISSSPENYSVHFDKKDIKIVFDEYIKIDKLNQNLIISPPMNTIPEVTPMGFASKSITIKILDTLKSNTTYSFNFGRSIVDNNEGNPFTALNMFFYR
ncbi:Ig-like domain-containing protein [Myroides ceti]|uniref:Ig-like domain-containing protein n=1 Tax=Paenimyroides ceti TaxID=395087 RepID=A0ABT8D4W0_9FLAO|nr:Ig-like domain-containing protein [Paenimyroides ceti]MDN3710470.1 Ig-like domain-containing protein [Paenimyroides ceti]